MNFVIFVKIVKSAAPLGGSVVINITKGEKFCKIRRRRQRKIVKFVNFAIFVKIVKSAAYLGGCIVIYITKGENFVKFAVALNEK